MFGRIFYHIVKVQIRDEEAVSTSTNVQIFPVLLVVVAKNTNSDDEVKLWFSDFCWSSLNGIEKSYEKVWNQTYF